MLSKFLVGLILILCGIAFCGGVWKYFTSREHSKVKINQAALGGEAMGSTRPQQYVLEVIGLGVTLDKLRQKKLWEALKEGDPYSSIRNMNSKDYPWLHMDKVILSRSHEGASLENGVTDTPRYWAVPVFNAEIVCNDEDAKDRAEYPQGGLVSGYMGMHLFVLEHRELAERPDRILEKIFIFFDKNPDVPYVLLGSADSNELRWQYSALKEPREDEYKVPEVPDASTLLVLARRERAEALRPYVFDDVEEPQRDVEILNRFGIGRQVFLAYLQLMKKIPLPPADDLGFKSGGRQPTSAEWLPEAARLAARPDIRGAAEISLSTLTNKLGFQKRPQLSSDWKPTPWFPVPWNREQLDMFDRLPTLGFLHRPVFVKMTDAEGKTLRQDSERVAALQAGWQDALLTLGEQERSTGPARVIVATGNDKRQLINFHGLLRGVAEAGGPQFDPEKTTQFIDTDRRLGDTGATTFFMQIALGLMGSYREGGVSAAFNLRDKNEASIVFVSPPSEEKRRTQHHPIGGDVFQNATVPAIDPKNYEEPVLR